MSSLQKIRQKTVEFHQLAAQPEECGELMRNARGSVLFHFNF